MPEEPGGEKAPRTLEDAPTPQWEGQPSGNDGSSLTPGQVLNERYWIQRLLGRGGMGEVWQALDLKLRVDVALKTLHPRFYADETRRELLRQEVRTAREVISPNVCRVYDLVEVEGRELLSMEHIDGETLLSLLRERCPLPLSEARDLALQFLTGLDAVHAAGLVHRDFKPENVMITRSGRVVVMDFGIAQKTERADGSVAGTPAYMAPEQSRGEAVDARTDLFAVGVVLAEMVSEAGVRDHASRKSVWEAVHEDPPRIPESPWSPVIRRAVAPLPAERPESAQVLIRSLQEITLRVEGAEEKHPYPGLASFTEDTAEHFFGREAEVESILRVLGRAHLAAVIGPSGAGKSSLLRAGLVPALPEGWGEAYCQPGDQPFRALAGALGADAEGADAILESARRWRAGQEEALVILDQFEELFTLSAPEVQSGFAALVGRLVSDADVRVLVSMRDDFLFHCQAHEGLAPVTSELTLLGPPAGAALNRALVQPALSLGYRFEDEALVTEMLGEVSRERGALPLLAFAAASLWERRDPDEGLLTREAYQLIGGVGGALAQHAEATLERIGRHREPVVREIFRNLVTARGTRAVRERHDLLSVFDDATAAEEVLGELIAARLLTSFDVSERGSGDATQRVEVIHESLLGAWPRLVRWQAEDQGGARLRDQLRQAARLWDERGRPDELLWTGASYLEYQAWRERYPGGLTALESDFTHAMSDLAGRQRRRRRVVVAAAFAILLAALATFGTLWQRSETAREQTEVARREAVDEARRAEASKLLALGRLELEQDTTASVAFALQSLELMDTAEARRFALEALWRGPVRFQVSADATSAVTFSGDGKWLAHARGEPHDDIQLWPSNGQAPRRLAADGVGDLVFGGHSRLLLTRRSDNRVVEVRSVPGGETLRRMEFERDVRFMISPDGATVLTTSLLDIEEGVPVWHLLSWPLGDDPPKGLGRFRGRGHSLDATGQWVAYAEGRGVYLLPVAGLQATPPRLLTRQDNQLLGVRLAPGGRALTFMDINQNNGFVTLDESAVPRHVFRAVAVPYVVDGHFSPDGSLMVAWSSDGASYVWDLAAPPGADPLALRLGESPVGRTVIDPSSRWAANPSPGGTMLWSIRGRHPHVLRGAGRAIVRLAFAPDGRWLVAASRDGSVRLWSLLADSGWSTRVLLPEDVRGLGVADVDVDPSGRLVLAGLRAGDVVLLPTGGGDARFLSRFREHFRSVGAVAFSPDGRWAAAAGDSTDTSGVAIRLWDLESGEVRVLEPEGGGIDWELDFARQGVLVAAGPTGVRVWNLEDGTSRLLQAGSCEMAMERDDRHVVVWCDDPRNGGRHDLETGGSEPLDLTSHPRQIQGLDVDADGRSLVTAGPDGVVRVGPVIGGEPHLLIGHEEGAALEVAVSPDGRWIASAGSDGTVRLWPMPEGPPFHTLPYEELLPRLRALTNVRVVEDDEAPTGYVLSQDPFPGWAAAPSW